jgi:inner membrane protein
LIVALRWRRPSWATGTAPARVGLLGLGLYIGFAYAFARLAESELLARFPQALRAQANPSAALPMSHRILLVEDERYRIFATDGSVHEVPREAPDAVVQAAMASHSIRGFVNWMRFPVWKIEDAGDHWRVRFMDLRYQGPDIPEARGIGVAEALVRKDGELGTLPIS